MISSFQKNLEKLIDDVNPSLLHSKFIMHQPSLEVEEKWSSVLSSFSND